MDGEELARRAVASKHWRWMRGMLGMVEAEGLINGVMPTVDLVGASYLHGYDADVGGFGQWRFDEILPDLDDPATLGCLLALVREAWGDPAAVCWSSCGGWTVLAGDDRELCGGSYPTESAALVAALEAAP